MSGDGQVTIAADYRKYQAKSPGNELRHSLALRVSIGFGPDRKQLCRAGAIGSGFHPCYTGILHHAEAGSSGLSPLEIPGQRRRLAGRKACATFGN